MPLDSDVVDLKKHIKTLKCILEKAREYPFLFNGTSIEFCNGFVSNDETIKFYISKDAGNLSLHFKDFNGAISATETLEYLAGKAVQYKLSPADLIRGFSNSIARPFADYTASRESKSLENQLLYELERQNQ
jgi:hypothetical protein